MRQILEIQFFLSNLFVLLFPMKKFAVILAVICVAVLGFSSCKKCYTCNFGANGGEQKFCSSDFPDKGVKGEHDLQLTINAYESNGYVCVEN